MKLRLPKVEFISDSSHEPTNDELAAREHRRIVSEALAPQVAVPYLGDTALTEAVALPEQRAFADQQRSDK